jgi:hypothetical protein
MIDRNCFTNVSKKDVNEIRQIIDDNINKNEKIIVILKGTWREYLICTEKQVYIIKKGFMTGHTFGDGVFRMPYNNITNAEVDYHLLTGYFELSAGGLQNKRLSYWSSDNNTDPAKQPNVITINTKELRDQFHKATEIILERVAMNTNSGDSAVQKSTTAADEIKKYKELLDMGAITQAEYSAKKKALLGL